MHFYVTGYKFGMMVLVLVLQNSRCINFVGRGQVLVLVLKAVVLVLVLVLNLLVLVLVLKGLVLITTLRLCIYVIMSFHLLITVNVE